jgi:anti-anti-sigma factor
LVHIDTDTTIQPNAVRLLVEGELDALAVGAFNAAITRAALLHRRVELDLSEVDFIDGSGLSMLMNAASRARRAGYELAIVEASRQVRRLVEITDTADRLPPLPPTGDGGRAHAGRRFASTAAAAAGTPAFKI